MQIYAHERGNPYGCTYFISFHEIELVILLVWKDNFFTYNKQEVENNLNKMADVSTSAKEQSINSLKRLILCCIYPIKNYIRITTKKQARSE